MQFISLQNFRGSQGSILVTKLSVPLKVGDHYIAQGFSGENIFTWTLEQSLDYPNQIKQKVIAISLDFDKKTSSIVSAMELPRIDI